MLEFVRLYGSQLSAIGAALVFLFGAYKYLRDRQEAHYWKEFEVFHKLVRELVEPSGADQVMYTDRQAAILFELRNFRRYYPYSLRMLYGLRAKWGPVSDQHPRLLEELDLTIAYLKPKRWYRRRNG